MFASGAVKAVELYESPCAPVDICDWTTSGDPDYGLPLGSPDTASCELSYNTFWDLDTSATATCTFDGDLLESAMLSVSINNDIVSCTLNGNEVFGSTFHEGCAPEDPRDGFSADILEDVIYGENTLVCVVTDRGVMTHFDACVVGEYSAPQVCELTVTSPEEGEWFDSEAVPIEWELSEGCTPIDHFWLYYKKGGDCNDLDHGWFSLTDGSNAAFGDGPYSWLWDRPASSGQYCVKVKVTSNGARDASGVFNVDLARPEVSLDVSEENTGYCEDDTEEENGVCYVNTDTEIGLNCEETTNDPWQSGVDYTEYRYSLDDGDSWTEWTEASSFSFPEDSNHFLQ